MINLNAASEPGGRPDWADKRNGAINEDESDDQNDLTMAAAGGKRRRTAAARLMLWEDGGRWCQAKCLMIERRMVIGGDDPVTQVQRKSVNSSPMIT